jgi:hypothetical protein
MFDQTKLNEYENRLTAILQDNDENKDMEPDSLVDELESMEDHLEFLAQDEGLKIGQKKNITHISNLIKKVKQELDFFDPKSELDNMFPNGYTDEDTSPSSFWKD